MPFRFFSRRRFSSDASLPVVLIMAHNESAYLPKTLRLLWDSRLPIRVVVVDDGSSDGTSRIATKWGAEVVSLSKNRGKASAFFAGLKAISRATPLPPCVITLDADMVHLPPHDLQKLIFSAGAATRKGVSLMDVAGVTEMRVDVFRRRKRVDAVLPRISSGIRSFSIPAVFHLVSSRHKSLAKGFGLERFLEYFFSSDRTKKRLEATFVSHPAFRKGQRLQASEVELTSRRLGQLHRSVSHRRRLRG